MIKYFVSIGDKRIAVAGVHGQMVDSGWDNRASKSIEITGLDYDDIKALFVNNVAWSIVSQTETFVPVLDKSGSFTYDENNETVVTAMVTEEVFDNSEYCVVGDITDHNNGTFTIKMGKLTALEEAYEILLGGDL